MVQARRLHELMASGVSAAKPPTHPKRTRHVTPCVPFDCHGYTRPAVSFPPPPENKRAARQDFVAAVAGCAQPSRARRYLLNTPESTSSGSSTPERLQAATWETSTQRLDGTRTPRPTVGRILFSPGQVTYDHRCRETRLPRLAKREHHEGWDDNGSYEAQALPPLRAVQPRQRTRTLPSTESDSRCSSRGSQQGLHKHDIVEEGTRQANPQTLNFRTVLLPNGSTINVSFVNEYNRHSYMPWVPARQ